MEERDANRGVEGLSNKQRGSVWKGIDGHGHHLGRRFQRE